MAKKFDVYFDKTTSYDIELGNRELVYEVYLGGNSKQADIFIESLPLHIVVEPTENAYLVINSNSVEVEVYGALAPSINYICLDSSVTEKVHKYEYTISNDICAEYDIEGCLIKIVQPNGSGIEMSADAVFVVRRLRHLYDLDNNTLRSFETQTLEDLAYIIVPI